MRTLADRLLLGSKGSSGGFVNPYNEEFNRPLPAAWTVNATSMPPAVFSYNVNSTKPDCFYGSVTASGSNASLYLWRSSPPAPFTVTAKIAGAVFVNTNPQDCGLGVGQADPNNGYVQVMCPSSYTGGITAKETTIWSALNVFTDTLKVTTYSGYTGPLPPEYLRLVVHSATNVDFCYSPDGTTWETYQAGYNPQTVIGGWTPGSVVLTQHVWNGNTTEAWWDWVRFT